MENKTGATIFGYPVKDARAFGVVEFDQHHKAISRETRETKKQLCRTGTIFL